MRKSELLEFERAGYLDVNGRLGRSLPVGGLHVPDQIELDDDGKALQWTPVKFKFRIRLEPRAMASMFHNFVRLWHMPPSAILRFARRWGVLWLDACGI